MFLRVTQPIVKPRDFMEIAEFQHLMQELYFQNDSQRGISRTALWLVEEMGELMHELKKPENDINRDAIGEEMADLYAGRIFSQFAWIHLNLAIETKYPGYCVKCGRNPCVCQKELG